MKYDVERCKAESKKDDMTTDDGGSGEGTSSEDMNGRDMMMLKDDDNDKGLRARLKKPRLKEYERYYEGSDKSKS